MATMTSRKLRLAGACSEQIALFKALGGDKKKITAKLCAAHASQFDWNWAARYLLSPEKHAEYERIITQAWAEYRCIIAPAWAEYRRIYALALAEYERTTAPAWAEYERTTAPARAEYERIRDTAWAEYQRTTAVTFWKLYSAQ